MQYTKNDIFILNSIRSKGGVNELRSVPITTIVEASNLSHTKVRATIKLLLTEGYIKEGFMQKNAKTYFISESGQSLLNKFIGKKED